MTKSNIQNAQEMFEKLGYKKDERHGDYDIRYIIQTGQNTPCRVVEFYEGAFACYLEYERKKHILKVGESTLKAINIQMEELRWK